MWQRLIFLTTLLQLVFVAVITAFEPLDSSTFLRVNDSSFQVSYIDESSITGYVAQDVVRVGAMESISYFGIITDSNGLWEGDGILGLGFPKKSNILGAPLFFSEAEAQDPTSTLLLNPQTQVRKQTLPHVFTVVLSATSGELQIGGYDPEIIDPNQPDTVDTPILRTCTEDNGISQCSFENYLIGVQEMRIGDTVLTSGSHKAVLDSGTTCIILPGTSPPDATGPYGALLATYNSIIANTSNNNIDDIPPLTFKIEGQEFQVPFKELLMQHHHNSSETTNVMSDDESVEEQLCVLTVEDYPEAFILGDAFLRNIVAVHNLTDLESPSMKLGQRNPNYEPLSTAVAAPSIINDASQRALTENRYHRFDLNQHHVSRGSTEMRRKKRKLLERRTSTSNVVYIPLQHTDILYSISLDIGTPPQQLEKIMLDTGSSIFAIKYQDELTSSTETLVLLIIIASVLLIALIGLVVYSKFRQSSIRQPAIIGSTQPAQLVV